MEADAISARGHCRLNTHNNPTSDLRMPRYNKDPTTMTAQEELRSLLKWAEQQRFENVAAALRRVLAKFPKAQLNP